MHAQPAAEHDFPRDVGRFRHLDHLAEHQLLYRLDRQFAARHQFAYHHPAQLHGWNAMKTCRLTQERRAKSVSNGDAIARTRQQRLRFAHLFHL